MKTKITVLIILCMMLLFVGCTNMQINDNSQAISAVDSQLLASYNAWDINQAEARLAQLESNRTISATQSAKIQAMLDQRGALKNALNPFVEAMKTHLSENDTSYLKAHVYPTLVNSMMVGQMSQYDLSQANFYYGKVTFNNQFCKFILIVNYANQSVYFEVTLIAANNQWWIYDVKEIQ